MYFNAFLFTTHYCKVDHFSKYGLSDSDEEDIPVSDVKKFKPTVRRQEEKQQKEQQKKTEQQLLATEVSAVGSNMLYRGGDYHFDVQETIELENLCYSYCAYSFSQCRSLVLVMICVLLGAFVG